MPPAAFTSTSPSASTEAQARTSLPPPSLPPPPICGHPENESQDLLSQVTKLSSLCQLVNEHTSQPSQLSLLVVVTTVGTQSVKLIHDRIAFTRKGVQADDDVINSHKNTSTVSPNTNEAAGFAETRRLFPRTRPVSQLQITVSDRTSFNVPILAWGDFCCRKFSRLSTGDVVFLQNVILKFYFGKPTLSASSRTSLRVLQSGWFFRNSISLQTVDGNIDNDMRPAVKRTKLHPVSKSSSTNSSPDDKCWTQFCALCRSASQDARWLYKRHKDHFQRALANVLALNSSASQTEPQTLPSLPSGCDTDD